MKRGEVRRPWAAWEKCLLSKPGLTAAVIAERTGRTEKAVESMRREMRERMKRTQERTQQ
ncbi:hypothetical protein [Methyloceanibacter caenitepidi]|uniref:Uncharacterized protein n=1 Tax=Methyloceanibacter caenitepidi TaxID=1384459 RepID=A0A0A8K003_9HYPH|nr:hypothetical protein [Methyloceanibacter caenitepidi]BAQ16061.1 hypothetical protein GL4_0598 [Methyloceanibacter caenitepidi]